MCYTCMHAYMSVCSLKPCLQELSFGMAKSFMVCLQSVALEAWCVTGSFGSVSMMEVCLNGQMFLNREEFTNLSKGNELL